MEWKEEIKDQFWKCVHEQKILVISKLVLHNIDIQYIWGVLPTDDNPNKFRAEGIAINLNIAKIQAEDIANAIHDQHYDNKIVAICKRCAYSIRQKDFEAASLRCPICKQEDWRMI